MAAPAHRAATLGIFFAKILWVPFDWTELPMAKIKPFIIKLLAVALVMSPPAIAQDLPPVEEVPTLDNIGKRAQEGGSALSLICQYLEANPDSVSAEEVQQLVLIFVLLMDFVPLNVVQRELRALNECSAPEMAPFLEEIKKMLQGRSSKLTRTQPTILKIREEIFRKLKINPTAKISSGRDYRSLLPEPEIQQRESCGPHAVAPIVSMLAGSSAEEIDPEALYTDYLNSPSVGPLRKLVGGVHLPTLLWYLQTNQQIKDYYVIPVRPVLLRGHEYVNTERLAQLSRFTNLGQDKLIQRILDARPESPLLPILWLDTYKSEEIGHAKDGTPWLVYHYQQGGMAHIVDIVGFGTEALDGRQREYFIVRDSLLEGGYAYVSMENIFARIILFAVIVSVY